MKANHDYGILLLVGKFIIIKYFKVLIIMPNNILHVIKYLITLCKLNAENGSCCRNGEHIKQSYH